MASVRRARCDETSKLSQSYKFCSPTDATQWRPYHIPLQQKRASLRTPFFNPPILDTLYSGSSYWQDSQVPPVRIASIEQAVFSSTVKVVFSTFFSAFSTVAFSIFEAPKVRR